MCVLLQLSSKRLRDGKPVKSIRPATAAVTISSPSTVNAVVQGRIVGATPTKSTSAAATRSAALRNGERKPTPNQTSNHRLLLAAARNHHHHPGKQLNVLKTTRQKALLKAKQQQHQKNQQQQQQQSSKSKKLALPMVISVPIEGNTPAAPSPVATSKINGNNGESTKATATENSESEYSSLEDDDDFTVDVAEGDANDSLSESEETNVASLTNSSAAPIDRSHLPNVTMIADCVAGRPAPAGPLSSSLFPHVPPYITFSSHEDKGPQMPPEITKILKWKLTTITPLVIRRILINSGFRLLKSKLLCFCITNHH